MEELRKVLWLTVNCSDFSLQISKSDDTPRVKVMIEAIKNRVEIDELEIDVYASEAFSIEEQIEIFKELEDSKKSLKADEFITSVKISKICTMNIINLLIGGHYLRVEGGKAIGELLKANTTMTELVVSSNEIGVAGGKAIGVGLKTNSGLKILDISIYNVKKHLGQNEIGVEGGIAIGAGLKTNSTLKKLDISTYNV